jgi:hypothetical protein
MKAWVTSVLLVLFAVPLGQAADNVKAFPSAEKGMARYVFTAVRPYLPEIK